MTEADFARAHGFLALTSTWTHGDQSRAIVYMLLAEVDRLQTVVDMLQKQVPGHCERIAAQSELLSKKAEKDESE